MPPLKDATKQPDLSGFSLVAQPPSAARPVPTPDPNSMPNYEALSLAPAPAVMSTEIDRQRQFYRHGVSQYRISPLPSKANPSLNASAQSIMNRALAAISFPAIPPQITDGLTHGDTVWEHDSAYVELRDDFVTLYSTTFGSAAAVSPSPVGELGWYLQPASSSNNPLFSGGNPPYMGQISFENSSTTSAFLSLLLNQGLNIGGGLTPAQFQRNSFALLENPGWKMTWIFKHDITAGSVGDFQTVRKSFYVGLSGPTIQNITTLPASGGTARPDIFIGLRYDTSTVPCGMLVSNSQTGGIYFGVFNNGGANAYAGQNITFSGFGTAANNGTFLCTASTTTSLTVNNASSTNESPASIGGQPIANAVLAGIPLTAAANTSGGNTVYTMVDVNTVGSGANGAYIGLTFVVTGFTNAANNGTFTCVQSTNTTLTLNNASGVAETHQGFATTTSLNDSFYTFEVVENPQYQSAARHNKQGQTFVTSVAPIAGIWHRLDMTCSAAGVVVMTLDGSATNTWTVTVPKITYIAASGQASWTSYEGRVALSSVGTSGNDFTAPFASGSVVTISGLPIFYTTLNGTWTDLYVEGPSNAIRWAMPTRGSLTNGSVSYTAVGYPSLTPVFTYGNDDTAFPITGTMRSVVDFFSLVWNPNLGPSAPGTPDKTKARYW